MNLHIILLSQHPQWLPSGSGVEHRDPGGSPRQNRATRGDRLRLGPPGLASVEPRARSPYALPPWGILVIRCEEKTVIADTAATECGVSRVPVVRTGACGPRPGSPMSGGYHARLLTDGVPVRSMKQLFELALRLEPPWRVVSSDFDFERRRVDVSLGFRARSRFPCPHCGRACQAVEFTEGTWRQPDVMAFEAFVTARLPVHPLSRARRRGSDAVLGERPRLASGPDPRRKHRPAPQHLPSPQLASVPSTRELRASQPASSSLTGRRLFSRAITGIRPTGIPESNSAQRTAV